MFIQGFAIFNGDSLCVTCIFFCQEKTWESSKKIFSANKYPILYICKFYNLSHSKRHKVHLVGHLVVVKF